MTSSHEPLATTDYTFSTMYELLQTKTLQIGDTITLLGYYTPYDGAGHQRYISDISSATSVPYGNLYANILYSDTLYSTWFGCKQDGITDDTLYFQAFLNCFGLAKLIVPSGIICISKMLILKGIFRNQPPYLNNLSFREIQLRGAAIKYTGPPNTCSFFICFHFNSIIDGLTLHDESSPNYINFCSFWNSDFRNFHVHNLFINENNLAVDPLHLDGAIYYQFNMSFSRGDITGQLKITSTPQDINQRTWLVNNLFFTYVLLGSETIPVDYNILLYGGAGLENVNFVNCDISYATKAIFYIDTDFDSATFNLKQCYFDSATPLTSDFNHHHIFFNLYDNFEASHDGKQLIGLKTQNMITSTHSSSKGVEANYFPANSMNLILNGNLSYATRDARWLLDDGAYEKLITTSPYSLYGQAIICIFDRTLHRNGIHFLTIPLPTSGIYTAGIRLKKLSGTGTLQLILANHYFKNFDLSSIKDNEEVILSTYGNGTLTLDAGTSTTIQLYAYGLDTKLTLEIYEIIFIPGTYISWNLSLHPKANLTQPTTVIDPSDYYTKSEMDTLVSASSSYYDEDLLFYKESDLMYTPNLAKALPDFHTKHIICTAQQLPLYNMLSDFVVSLLTAPPGILSHHDLQDQWCPLPQLKIIPYGQIYYFTIRVDRISSTPPTLQLKNHNPSNQPISFSGLTGTTGLQKIQCSVGGNPSIYSADSILKPQIGITDNDLANGRYITYEILGVYHQDILGLNENFIGGIKFPGEHFDGRPDGIQMTLNGTSYTLPVLRGFYGWSDYIRHGKVYRRILKKRITPEMVDILTHPWSTIYKIGSQSSMVMLNPEMTDFIQSPDPWYKDNGLRWYIWSPTLPTHPFVNNANFGGEAPMRCIFYGNAYSYTGKRIILKLTHEDIHYDYEKDPLPTAAELVEKYKVWLAENPTYIYYPVNNPIEEPLGFKLPSLLGDKTLNTLSFDTGSSLSIAPTVRLRRHDTSYRHLSGHAWLMIGDSITESMGSLFNYPALVNNLVPDCLVYNYGKSGSSVCSYPNGGRAWAPYLETSSDSLPDYADLITINLGINDRKPALDIGHLEDAPHPSGSFHAAFKSIILSLTQKYPLARLVILSPVRLFDYLTPDFQLYQIIQAEKEEAAYFNLEFIDLQTMGGVNNFYPTQNNAWGVSPMNYRGGWLTADGLHYNDLAHRLLFETLLRKL